jgi:hypothetical protein
MTAPRKSLSAVLEDVAKHANLSRTRGAVLNAALLDGERASASPSSGGVKRKTALVVLSRHDPAADGGYYRYRVNDPASQPVPLDELLVQHGHRCQQVILNYDDKNDVQFVVSDVVSEVLVAGNTHAMIRFYGYPSDFDMLHDIRDNPYSGFVDAYMKFKKQAVAEPAEQHEPHVQPIDEIDLVLEPMEGVLSDHADADDDDKGKGEAATPAADATHNPSLGYDIYDDGDNEHDEDDDDVDVDDKEFKADSSSMLSMIPVLGKHEGKRRKSRSRVSVGKRGRPAAGQGEGASDELEIEHDSDDMGLAKQTAPTSSRKKVSKVQFLKKAMTDKIDVSKLKSKGSLAALFFEDLKDDKGSYRCKLCHQPKASAGNYSNLVKHLDHVHRTHWAALQNEHKAKKDVVAFLKNILAGSVKTDTPRASTQSTIRSWLQDGAVHNLAKTRLSLLVWAIKSSIPFNPFDAKEFGEFASHAGFSLDSAYEMKKKTATLHSVFGGLAEARLAKCSSVSITADMWTSLADEHYLVLTYHGIDPRTFEMIHHVLDLQIVFGSATGNLIATVVRDRIMAHLGEKKHVVALVLDSGSNMLKSGKILGIQVQKCFAHGLKGVIDAVCGKQPTKKQPELHEADVTLDIASVRAVVEVLRMSSWLKDDVLGEDTLELILENITRWEGLFLAVQRFLKLKEKLKGNKRLLQYFSDVKTKLVVVEDVLLKSFFERLEGHYRLLKAFHEVSVLSQYEKQCSIAWVPSWIWKIKKACKASGSTFGKKLQQAVDIRLVPKYLSAASLALKAGLLNPYVTCKIQTKLKESVVNDTWASIVQDAINANAVQDDVESEERREHGEVLRATLPLLRRHMSQWQDRKREEAKKLGLEDWKKNADVFEFWRNATTNAPNIAVFVPVACRYLGIPATSAPSERSFSSSGLVVTKLRNRIGPDLLERVVVCRDWIMQPCYSFDETIQVIEQKLGAADEGQNSSDDDD